MELHYLSATEALKKFKNKTLSPLELTKAIIDRAKKINPKINAHNFTFYEKAIKLAKGTPLIVSIERPKAKENTAKKSRELIAGPKIV